MNTNIGNNYKTRKEMKNKQKFKRGSRVHVCKEMPYSMSHFPSDFDAIVVYTYAQEYGGYNIDSYHLLMLDDGIGISSISWYKENQLTLIDDDTSRGHDIIDDYTRCNEKNR